MEPIRAHAVSFDARGALIHAPSDVGMVLSGIVRSLGLQASDPKRLQARSGQALPGAAGFHHAEESCLGLVRRTFEGMLSPEECKAVCQSARDHYARADSWRVHEDAVPLLDELAGRGFRLAIVSNWNPWLRRILSELRLLSYFDAVSISGEVGFPKPSPVLFEHVLRNLGLPGSMVVHVGDSMVEDVDGAENAGLTGVLLDRSSERRAGAISSLSELLPMIQEGWLSLPN